MASFQMSGNLSSDREPWKTVLRGDKMDEPMAFSSLNDRPSGLLSELGLYEAPLLLWLAN